MSVADAANNLNSEAATVEEHTSMVSLANGDNSHLLGDH